MREMSIVHECTGRSFVREFYPMRFLWVNCIFVPSRSMLNLLNFWSWQGKFWQGKFWQGKFWQGKFWQGKFWQAGKISYKNVCYYFLTIKRQFVYYIFSYLMSFQLFFVLFFRAIFFLVDQPEMSLQDQILNFQYF
jgi:hypothetical protein